MTLDETKQESDFSESLSIEIPTKGNQKIRITNVYIPPVYTRGERREEWFNTEKWPSERYDIMLGDINGHSTTWNNNIESDKSDKRGEMAEE